MDPFTFIISAGVALWWFRRLENKSKPKPQGMMRADNDN